MSYSIGYEGYGALAAYSNKGGSVDVTDYAALRAAMTGGSKPPAPAPAKKAAPAAAPPAAPKKKAPVALIVIWLAATVAIAWGVQKYGPKTTRRK